MILCKIDVECNSACKRCCKHCDIFINGERCKVEGICIFAKRHATECGSEFEEIE